MGGPAPSERRRLPRNEIAEPLAALLETLHDVSVFAGGSAIGADARVPDDAWQPLHDGGLDTFDDERAPIEAEACSPYPVVPFPQG
jgi:hypothetical protein